MVVEDEKLAAERLCKLIMDLEPLSKIEFVSDSISSVVAWLNANPPPEIAFMDIQLSDGLSFEIFEQVDIRFPVIFTTAFDEYALRAFKVNSIDYLLKPVDNEELKFAISKYYKIISNNAIDGYHNARAIDSVMEMLVKKYKTRFLVRAGDHYRTYSTTQIAFFYSLSKATFFNTFENKNLDVDYSLDELEKILDPAMFFRVNRQFIINISAIADMLYYSNSRLKIRLVNPTIEEVIVSREKVSLFKDWLNG
jgi:DNA-binding LytR/AlgR family response regulator